MFVIAGRKKKREQEFSSAQWAEITSIMTASSCGVTIFKEKVTRTLLSVKIEFTGPLAHFPSGGNDRQILHRNFTDKRGITRRIAFNAKSIDSQIKLKAGKELFTRALVNSGQAMPCFFDERTRITGLFAAKKGRWDVHNQIKPMCDWIEALGIINDDQNARAMAERKDDWPERFPDQAVTTIVIQRESDLHGLVAQQLTKIHEVATGALRLFG